MAQRVAGDQMAGLLSQLFEVERQLRQLHGYPFDPEKLRRHLQNAIEGKFDSASAFVLAHDKTKDGWTLVEHCPRRITSARDLELVPFLRDGENYVQGEEMVRRARVELDANYGQEDAEWLLENQDQIPAEFRKYYLLFTGTVWRGSLRRRRVACLYWGGGQWLLDWFWLDYGWDSFGRLLRPRK